MLQNHLHFVRVRDGELTPLEQFVCHLYGTLEQPTVVIIRRQPFNEVKLGLEMLSQNRGALKPRSHCTCLLPGKVWLQANHEHKVIPSPINISAGTMESNCLNAYVQDYLFSRCGSTVGHLWMQVVANHSRTNACKHLMSVLSRVSST